jgi:hypothetical protein
MEQSTSEASSRSADKEIIRHLSEVTSKGLGASSVEVVTICVVFSDTVVTVLRDTVQAVRKSLANFPHLSIMSHYITNSGTPPLYPLPSPLAQA